MKKGERVEKEGRSQKEWNFSVTAIVPMACVRVITATCSIYGIPLQ